MIARSKPLSEVVVVDANPSDYLALSGSSGRSHLKFTFFESAREALRYQPETDPGLWLVNMHLSDMSGLDLNDMLSSRWPDSPVYMIGDDYRPEDEIHARTSGATFYFCKPILPEWVDVPSNSLC